MFGYAVAPYSGPEARIDVLTLIFEQLRIADLPGLDCVAELRQTVGRTRRAAGNVPENPYSVYSYARIHLGFGPGPPSGAIPAGAGPQQRSLRQKQDARGLRSAASPVTTDGPAKSARPARAKASKPPKTTR